MDYKISNYLLIFYFAQFLITPEATKPLQVIYAVNAGGQEHIDKNGIHYQSDPLRGKIGTESDYGKSLLMIARAPENDEILYQTERYHTATFGYDIPIAGDGEYVLVLKFCEVYFNAPNMKVFDVVLNGDHTVIADLDIFANVGKGAAHDEYVYFTISRGRLYYKEEESEIRGGKIRIEFIKGIKDNPKINAFALLKGDVARLPKLPPAGNEAIQMPQTSMETEIPNEDIIEKPISQKVRKTSGPKQPNPYSMDDSSVMLPVIIALGAFIPLLFCLCKL
ncbi:malectin-A [Condylostylus longicornis]|uniref:malectin-A n=1 Tax=Condylostylus longicornis TaxID=2530218 RepID=UPI00244DA758|nr:malectin-A [Condylostylus longicornis]XP_055386443.1 malectin-A [Condylostylus longicornis]